MNNKKKMKLQYYITLLFTVFIFSNNIQSQNNQTELVGTWIFDYEASITKMESKAKALFGKMKETQKNHLESLYIGRVMSFTTDGNFSQQISESKTTTGTWTLNKNNKKLELSNAKGKKLTLKISMLNTTSLVLKLIETGNRRALISEWHFKKN